MGTSSKWERQKWHVFQNHLLNSCIFSNIIWNMLVLTSDHYTCSSDKRWKRWMQAVINVGERKCMQFDSAVGKIMLQSAVFFCRTVLIHGRHALYVWSWIRISNVIFGWDVIKHALKLLDSVGSQTLQSATIVVVKGISVCFCRCDVSVSL